MQRLNSHFWQFKIERYECLPLNSKFTRKSVLVKTKPFNRQSAISINQLINCSKCCPLARTHALSFGRHWSMALSMTLSSAWTQPRQKLTAALDHIRSSRSRPFSFKHFWGNPCSNWQLLKDFKSTSFLISILFSALKQKRLFTALAAKNLFSLECWHE